MNATNSLLKYLSFGHTDRKSRVLSLFSGYKVAEDLFSQIDWKTFACTAGADDPEPALRIDVAGKHTPVSHPVFRYLEANPHPAIIASSLFGSLADGTACAYSDFDGILFIDCSRIQSAVSLFRLRNIIARSEELMLETDPIQHHGWHIVFIDAEQRIISSDLPTGVLVETKVVFPSKSLELALCSSIRPVDAIESYRKTSASVRSKLSDSRSAACIYTFKNLCSEFMLMPALFLQAMGNPVSKKNSFNLIEQFLNQDQLSALRTVTAWRRNWEKPELNRNVRLFHAAKKRGLRLSFLLPELPDTLRNSYPEWRTRAESFLQACDQAIEQHQTQ